jgi:hypothetical protein
MQRRRALSAGATALMVGFAGCSSDGAPDTLTLQIESNTGWYGNLSSNEFQRQIQGSGDESFEWTDENPGTIDLTIHTDSRTDATLTVSVLEDGEVETEKSVSGANERLRVVHTV